MQNHGSSVLFPVDFNQQHVCSVFVKACPLHAVFFFNVKKAQQNKDNQWPVLVRAEPEILTGRASERTSQTFPRAENVSATVRACVYLAMP